MKKLLILIFAFTSSIIAIAQDDRMGNNHGYSNGNSNGNTSFSTTEMLLGGILLVLIVAGLVWFFNNKNKGK